MNSIFVGYYSQNWRYSCMWAWYYFSYTPLIAQTNIWGQFEIIAKPKGHFRNTYVCIYLFCINTLFDCWKQKPDYCILLGGIWNYKFHVRNIWQRNIIWNCILEAFHTILSDCSCSVWVVWVSVIKLLSMISGNYPENIKIKLSSSIERKIKVFLMAFNSLKNWKPEISLIFCEKLTVLLRIQFSIINAVKDD